MALALRCSLGHELGDESSEESTYTHPLNADPPGRTDRKVLVTSRTILLQRWTRMPLPRYTREHSRRRTVPIVRCGCITRGNTPALMQAPHGMKPLE